MKRQSFDVDIVISWVDGNDQSWIRERNRYRKQYNLKRIDTSVNRYRDWGLLKYIFRGIDEYAPWVRKVFFITCGQIPSWLNTKCQKLVLVNHKDYIPKKYLPTFSANPIEINLHRIKNLSEHFIYFNDDTFITKACKKSDFFSREGLPKYPAIEKAPALFGDKIFCNITTNNICHINNFFNKKNVKFSNIKKWYLSGLLPLGLNLFNDILSPRNFVGLYSEHIPSPFLKSEISLCWNDFYDILNSTSLNKFRSIEDVNQYLFKYYLLCKNRFCPSKIGRLWNRKLPYANLNLICKEISSQKKKIVCLFDNDNYPYLEGKRKLDKAFSSILPNKSSFENL